MSRWHGGPTRSRNSLLDFNPSVCPLLCELVAAADGSQVCGITHSSECCRIWDVVMGLPLPSPAAGVRGALGEHILLVHIAVEMPPCHLVPWLVSWGGCRVREDPSCPVVCRQAQSQRCELGLEM